MEKAQQKITKQSACVVKMTWLLVALTACFAGGPEVHESALPPDAGGSEGALTQEAQVLPPIPGITQIALVTHFEREVAPEIVVALQEELYSILGPLGLDVAWIPLSEVAGRSFTQRLVVVRFKGWCVSGTGAAATFNGPLGHTHFSDGKVLPFIELNCDKVMGFIIGEARRSPQPALLGGIALARVLSHELYHVIADTTRHANRGVAKAALTTTELTQGALRFGDPESSLIMQKVIPARRRGPNSLLHAGM